MYCQVCGVEADIRMRLGAMVCEACKRFYLRHRTKGSKLVCAKDESGKCINNQDFASQQLTCAGNVWRLMCPSCRFDRCLQSGVGSTSKPSTPYESNERDVEENSNKTVRPKRRGKSTENRNFKREIVEMSDANSTESEIILQNLVNGSKHLFEHMDQLNLRNVSLTNKSFHELWTGCCNHFNSLSSHMTAFFKGIPGFLGLSVEERCIQFSAALPRVMIAENCQIGKPVHILGIGIENFRHFASFFPSFAHLEQDQFRFQVQLMVWNPDVAEFAFLLAFLFYGFIEHSEQYSTVDSLNLGKSYDKVRTAYTTYMSQRYQHDQVQRQTEVVTFLKSSQEAAIKHFSLFSQLMESRPELFNQGGVFTEVLNNHRKQHHFL